MTSKRYRCIHVLITFYADLNVYPRVIDILESFEVHFSKITILERDFFKSSSTNSINHLNSLKSNLFRLKMTILVIQNTDYYILTEFNRFAKNTSLLSYVFLQMRL